MDPKVPLFDIVNDRNRPTAPLFCSECRLHRLSANGSVVGLSAPANVSTLLVWGRDLPAEATAAVKPTFH